MTNSSGERSFFFYITDLWISIETVTTLTSWRHHNWKGTEQCYQEKHPSEKILLVLKLSDFRGHPEVNQLLPDGPGRMEGGQVPGSAKLSHNRLLGTKTTSYVNFHKRPPGWGRERAVLVSLFRPHHCLRLSNIFNQLSRQLTHLIMVTAQGVHRADIPTDPLGFNPRGSLMCLQFDRVGHRNLFSRF